MPHVIFFPRPWFFPSPLFATGCPNKKTIIAGTKEMLQSEKSVWHEIIDGIRYIRSQKEISFIFWMMSILFAAVGAIYVVIIVFIQQAFHSVTKDLGFLAVPLGLGIISGKLGLWKMGEKDRCL